MKHLSTIEIWIYYLTVFITGTAVLIIEIAAVRQLTPIFGGSIYVLSSVLSVILLALSVGYFFGGRLADRFPTHNILYFIITTSGLSLLLLQLFEKIYLPYFNISSIISGPLIIAFIFFFIPAVLLGMDSPYVIKLITSKSVDNESGKYVGTTFFWSTIGSITGSLSAGFWLIPNIGVQSSITYTALLLVILGIVFPIFLSGKDFYKYILSNLLYIVFVIIFTAFIIQQIKLADKPDVGILFKTDGLYSQIIVKETSYDRKPAISLWRDLNNSSAIFLDSYEHVFAYSQFMDLYDVLVNKPNNFLLIGGGAYTIPRRLVAIDSEINIDVVEIEPVLFELAQKYFDLSDTERINNYVGDARIFLNQTENKYDVIFSDVFNTSFTAPWQLSTIEFYNDIKEVLNPGGVMLLNYIGGVDTNPRNMTSTFLNTIQLSFPYVEMYHSQTLEENQLQNIIFIVSLSPINTDEIADFEINTKNNGSLTLEELRIDTSRFSSDDRGVFTDDKAPVELLMRRQVQKYQSVI
jgi:spermidine synthase